MGKALADYNKVQEIRKANPDLTISAALKQAKVNYSSYYSGRKAVLGERRAALKSKVEPRPPFDRAAVQAHLDAHRKYGEGETPGLLRVIIGTAAQIREVLRP